MEYRADCVTALRQEPSDSDQREVCLAERASGTCAGRYHNLFVVYKCALGTLRDFITITFYHLKPLMKSLT